jgi:hypothetical protein
VSRCRCSSDRARSPLRRRQAIDDSYIYTLDVDGTVILWHTDDQRVVFLVRSATVLMFSARMAQKLA